jgi:hypothetical protein
MGKKPMVRPQEARMLFDAQVPTSALADKGNPAGRTAPAVPQHRLAHERLAHDAPVANRFG